MRILVACLLTAGIAAVAAESVQAQSYPTRPIRLIVPYGPGGSVDVLSRHFAQELGQEFRQTVVVENRVGASTGIGATAVVNSAPDGYTILVGTASTLSVNPVMFSQLTYQPSKLEPVVMFGKMPLIVVGALSLPKTLSELVAYGKANPGRLNYGTLGPGSLGHVIGEKFMTATGIRITPIPYKGHAPAIVDMKGERLEMLFDGLSSALPHIESGGLRAFALIAEKRSAAAPQIPTMAELGYPTMTTAFWIGLFAPVGVPAEAVAVLNAAVRKVAVLPALTKRLQLDGIEPVQMSAAEFKQFVSRDQEEWRVALASTKKLD